MLLRKQPYSPCSDLVKDFCHNESKQHYLHKMRTDYGMAVCLQCSMFSLVCTHRKQGIDVLLKELSADSSALFQVITQTSVNMTHSACRSDSQTFIKDQHQAVSSGIAKHTTHHTQSFSLLLSK